MRLPRYAAFCFLLLLPGMSRADDIGPDRANALQQQLKEWLAGLLGPSDKLPDLPWSITGEGDHYTIRWPIRGLDSPAGDVSAAATVRPLEGNRWSIDKVEVPPTAAFTMTIPDTGDKLAAGEVKVSYKLGAQDTHGVIDPSLNSPSALHTEVRDLSVVSDGTSQHQEQRFDRYLVDANLQPTRNGRLDFAVDATVNGWKSASQMNNGAPVAIGIDTMRAIGRIDGVNRERVGSLLNSVVGLVNAVPGDIGKGKDLPPPAKAQLRLMIASLQDMLSGASLEETLDGLRVEIAGIGGLAMKRFQIGFGGEAPEGILRVWLDLGMEGLDSPSLPPKLTAYLPRHAEMKPSLSGIRMTDLQKLAQDASEAGGKDDYLAPDLAAIFAHGGANVGIETLSFDLGPAKLEGTGHLTVLSPDTWRGEAHVVATGFDELTTQVRANPDMQKALPVLIMMRGLAKPDGQRLVWDIISDGPAVTVNGLDLSQLGGDAKKTQPNQKPRR